MRQKIIVGCLVIALLEGFAGLGIEIYAIRISATYIGSSISITGVILAMVLIAIAIGYWYGGRLSEAIKTPKAALLRAGHVLSLSAAAHAVACIFQLPLLASMVDTVDNSIVIAMGVGLIYGIGLAFGSAAIPLITQFLTLQYDESQKSSHAGRNAGMMVATTTIGSVLGSTLTPILLLPYIGLMNSLALFIIALTASAWLCTRLAVYARDTDVNGLFIKNVSANKNYVLSGLAVAVTLSFISVNTIDTGYQTAASSWFVEEIEYKGQPAVSISYRPVRSSSSCWLYETKKNCYDYGQIAIDGIAQTAPKSLVFLGGAGMAIPSEFAYAHPDIPVTVIDIDEGLPAIVETHFLKEPLAKNISFVGNDARAFFARNTHINYDYMLIDAFQGQFVASNLYTVEALSKFKATTKNIMANVIGVPAISHGYTQMLLNNWYKVFGESAYVITKPNYYGMQNIMLCNFACAGGVKISQAKFFNVARELHTDNMPRLDKYYYQSL